MFEKEFDEIWKRQDEFYRKSRPELSPEELETREKLEQRVRDLLFFQRPLASSEHLIGFCDLEPEERRAPWASLEAQRFRLLQKVNNLRYFSHDDMAEKPLEADRRLKLVNELQMKGDLTFPAIRKLLDMDKAEFNLQKPHTKDELKKKRSEGKVEGNRVNKVMLEVFGPENWNSLCLEKQVAIAEIWRATEGFENRKNRAAEEWGLDSSHAQIWASNRPPGSYCKHSRKAIAKLLDPEQGGMEKGVSYATAKVKMYGNPLAGKEPLPLVPKVTGEGGFLPSITNPAVIRALTELRKVVNAIIREFGGKPYEIRIELARELRKNRKQRRDADESNEKNHQRRLQAARKILAECKNYDPEGRDAEALVKERRDDVTKMLLHMECGGLCPYTGNSISYQQIFGGEVEVEHIIPQSMMVDNSFGNLTLSFRKTNLDKLDKTPWQVFGGPGKEQEWSQIMERVKKFDNRTKLYLFQLRTPDEARRFAARRLNDTRYTSKLAGRLLMSLYGGRDMAPGGSADDVDEFDEFKDRTGRRAVFVSSGMVTSLLRNAWCLHLNQLIGDDAFKCPDEEEENKGAKRKMHKKDRSDHRNHALDAVVIALTTEKLVQRINTLASGCYARQENGSYRPLTYRELMKEVRRGAFPECLEGAMLDDVRKMFREIVASHRPEHRLRGELHKAGFFGKERGESETDTPVRHKRISIKQLSEMDHHPPKKGGSSQMEKIINSIVDGEACKIKEIVRDFGNSIGGYQKWSLEKNGYPVLSNHRRAPVLIKKFTVEIAKNAYALDRRGQCSRKGYPDRNVEKGEIAYVSFFITQSRKSTKWKWDVVKLFDAAQRVRALRKHERATTRVCEHHPNFLDAIFRFSLMKGDTVELAAAEGSQIVIVRRFEGDGRVWIAPVNTAGTDEELKNSGLLRRVGLAEFLTMGPKGVECPQLVQIDLLGNRNNVKLGA